MKWDCGQIEDVMNYLRVYKGATTVTMFDIDRDRIAYYDFRKNFHSYDFSKLYHEMLDEQRKRWYYNDIESED